MSRDSGRPSRGDYLSRKPLLSGEVTLAHLVCGEDGCGTPTGRVYVGAGDGEVWVAVVSIPATSSTMPAGVDGWRWARSKAGRPVHHERLDEWAYPSEPSIHGTGTFFAGLDAPPRPLIWSLCTGHGSVEVTRGTIGDAVRRARGRRVPNIPMRRSETR